METRRLRDELKTPLLKTNINAKDNIPLSAEDEWVKFNNEENNPLKK